jgi:hypothetical protein
LAGGPAEQPQLGVSPAVAADVDVPQQAALAEGSQQVAWAAGAQQELSSAM